MQTAVLAAPPIGIPGMPADMHTSAHGDIVSATSEQQIPFGVMVAIADDEYRASAITLATDALKGIAVYGNWYSENELDETEVLAGTTFGVGRTGRYFVVIEETVAYGDEVHVRAVAGAGEIAGAFGKSDLGIDSINCSDFCSWVQGGTVGGDGFGIAIVEVDMALASALQASDS